MKVFEKFYIFYEIEVCCSQILLELVEGKSVVVARSNSSIKLDTNFGKKTVYYKYLII